MTDQEKKEMRATTREGMLEKLEAKKITIIEYNEEISRRNHIEERKEEAREVARSVVKGIKTQELTTEQLQRVCNQLCDIIQIFGEPQQQEPQ